MTGATHLAQRWITYRLRYALGDIFLGVYRSGEYRPILRLLVAQRGAVTASNVSRQEKPANERASELSRQLLLDTHTAGPL